MSENAWTWIGAYAGNVGELNREIERRSRLARRHRRVSRGRDDAQDDRLEALETRSEKLESLVVYLVARLVARGGLESGEAAEVLASLHDHLGEAELHALGDAALEATPPDDRPHEGGQP